MRLIARHECENLTLENILSKIPAEVLENAGSASKRKKKVIIKDKVTLWDIVDSQTPSEDRRVTGSNNLTQKKRRGFLDANPLKSANHDHEDSEDDKGRSLSLATPGAFSGPKMVLVNGEFQVDESSLFVDTQIDGNNGEPSTADLLQQLERDTEVDIFDASTLLVSPYANAYGRGETTRWSASDTQRFYKAVELAGIDLVFIAALLPDKTPRQVKAKLAGEQRKYPRRLSEAMNRHFKRGPEDGPKMLLREFENLHGKVNEAKHKTVRDALQKYDDTLETIARRTGSSSLKELEDNQCLVGRLLGNDAALLLGDGIITGGDDIQHRQLTRIHEESNVMNPVKSEHLDFGGEEDIAGEETVLKKRMKLQDGEATGTNEGIDGVRERMKTKQENQDDGAPVDKEDLMALFQMDGL